MASASRERRKHEVRRRRSARRGSGIAT
jgi:hypothetical protein